MKGWMVAGIGIVVAIVVAGMVMTNKTTAPASLDTESMEVSVSPTVSAQIGTVKEFTIEGSPFKFVPNVMRVKVGDTVRVTFKNVQGTHDFTLDEFEVQTETLATGESETVEFVADRAGTFEYYCSVMDHRAKGMVGSLIVE